MFYPAELTAPHPPYTHTHTHTQAQASIYGLTERRAQFSSDNTHWLQRRGTRTPAQPAQHLLSCVHTFIFQDHFIGHRIPAEQILHSANENTKAYGD